MSKNPRISLHHLETTTSSRNLGRSKDEDAIEAIIA